MQNNTPKRPLVSKQAIFMAAKQTAENVINTTRHCNLDLNELVDAIVLHWRYGMDAYQLAKKLDSYDRYRPDMEMLCALEAMSRNVDALYYNQLASWLNIQGINPPFPNGTEVKEGIIDSVDQYGIARYMIRQYDCNKSNTYLLKNFEDVTWVGDPNVQPSVPH